MLLAVLAYMGVVAGWKVLRIGSLAPLLSQWTFLIGIPVGALFVWIDVIVEAYLQPGSRVAMVLRRTMRQGGSMVDRARRVVQSLRTLASQEPHLCSQNVLFAGLWVVMALFGLTSTTSAFGKGVVLGIGLQLVARTLRSLREASVKGEQALQWFFWPVKQALSLKQERRVAKGFLAVFVLLTLLA